MVIFVAILLFTVAGLAFLLLGVWDHSIEQKQDNETYISGFSSGICDSDWS